MRSVEEDGGLVVKGRRRVMSVGFGRGRRTRVGSHEVVSGVILIMV